MSDYIDDKFEQTIPIPDSSTDVKYVLNDKGCWVEYKDENGNKVKVGFYEIESES